MNEALSGGGLFLLRTILSLASFLFLLRFCSRRYGPTSTTR